jgi:hypothetical protein
VRAPTELVARIQTRQFHARNEIGHRHGAFAHERYVVNGQREKGDYQADGKRASVAPPFAKQSRDAIDYACGFGHICRECSAPRLQGWKLKSAQG